MKNNKNKLLNVFITILPFLCVIGLWGIVALSVDNATVLPTFSQTAKEVFNLFTYSEFYTALFSTLLRSLIAFCISFLLAFLLAFLAKKYAPVKRFISPLISVIRALPTIAVVLLLVVWTSYNVAPVIVTMLVVLPTLYTNIYNALSSVSNEQLEMLKVYKVPAKTVLYKVQIPQILPEILSSVGAGFSLNVKLMVAAEVLAYTPSAIGHYLSLSKLYDKTVTMMALVLVVVVVGLLIEWIFNLLAKRAEVWK